MDDYDDDDASADVSHTSQRSLAQPSDSWEACSHPLSYSPTSIYNMACSDGAHDHPRAGNSRDLLSTAVDCFQAQDYNKVILLLEELCKAQLSSAREMAALLGCALAYYKIGDYKTSAAKFRLLQDTTSPTAITCGAQFLACVYLGDIHSIREEYQEAASCYSKAASCYTSSSMASLYHLQTPSLSSLYLKQGANLKRASNIMAAIAAYGRAIAAATTSKKDRLAAYTGLGTLHHTLGDHTSAVQQYTQALSLAEEEKDFISLAHAHGNIGNAYTSIHLKDKALYHLLKSLDLTVEHDPIPEAIGRAYNNLGTAYQSLGELDKAGEYYQLALDQCIYGKDLSGEARAYGNMGNVAMMKKDYNTAIEHFTETLLISSDPAILIAAHHNRGCCLSEKARRMASEVVVGGAQPQVTFHGPSVQCDQGGVLPKPIQGLYEEALEDLRAVIESHETTLRSIKGSGEGMGLSVSLAESSSRTFHYTQGCLCALGRPSEALVCAEQSRARSLGELLLRKKRAQCGRLYSPPLSFDDISSIVLAQNTDVVYLSYTGASLLVWVLSPVCKSVVTNMFEVRLDGVLFNGSTLEVFLHNTLTEHITDSTLEMFVHCDYSASSSPLHPLHGIVVKPLVRLLTAVHSCHLPQEIILVPDSHTLIPFVALLCPDGSGFLGDRMRFRIMPSILTMGLMCHAPSPQQSLTRVSIPLDSPNFCIVGDPVIPPFKHSGEDWRLGRLPHAGREARWVAHTLRGQALLQEGATKSRVCSMLESAKLVHLATHGGRVSGFLALGGSSYGPGDHPVDGSEVLLLPSEVERLTIRAAMVVLSSCDSGRGTVRADGIIGMGRAFLLAGAQSVLTTLWRIPDESAGMFMQFFYQYLVDGLGTTHALQKATLSVRCFKKYSQYAHWGGFQLIGRDVQFTVERTPDDKMVGTLLGPGSAFPCLDLLTKMEDALLVCSDRPSDVQILHSCSGLSSEEPVIDFITKHHTHFQGGVFWVNGSGAHTLRGGEEVLKASMAHCPQGTAPVATPTKPLLIVLDNVCTSVTSEAMLSIMRSCHAHIIVISAHPEAIQDEVHAKLSRGSSVHEVRPLSPLQATQRLVYALQSHAHFVPLNHEQEVLAQLADLSHGSPELIDAFSSLLLQCSSVTDVEKGLTKEIKLPKEDVVCDESGDWFAHVSHFLMEGFFPSSPAHLSPEEQLVLSSLSLFGETPIPQVVAQAVQEMVVSASCGASNVLERLRRCHLIKQYPSVRVVKPCVAALDKEAWSAVLLRVPRLIADAVWSGLGDEGRVMAVAVAHKALRRACLCIPKEDLYLSSLRAGLDVALVEAVEGVVGLTPDCYAQLYQPVAHDLVMRLS